MASLRKRPTDVDAEVVAGPAVSAEADAPPGPPPAPEPELDTASEALKRQLDALREAESVQQQQQIAKQVAEDRRQRWLASTPVAQEHIAKLGRLHHDALAGLADCSPSYFDFMESQLANLQQPAEAATHMVEEMQERAAQSRTPEPPPRSSGMLFSAPVSREVPSADGPRAKRSVKLTPTEQEMARVAGVSLEEYARQKLKLQTMKATGEYSEQQDQRR